MTEYPEKDSYKLSEVCQYTDTQPYVLRFWESEFPQLSPDKRGGGARVYRKADIDLVHRIKQLLYDEEYTIAGARDVLDEELTRGSKGRRSSAAQPNKKARPSAKSAPKAEVRVPVQRTFDETQEDAGDDASRDSVSRSRYEDAIDEIDHLRLQLKEAEKGLRKTETAMASAEEEAYRQRDRSQRSVHRLETLLKNLEA